MDNKFFEIFSKEGIEVSQQDLSKFFLYKDLLLHWNEKINLTAIVDDKEIFYKHFLDSLLLLKIPGIDLYSKNVIDIGTGAGLPGLPLAITNHNLKVSLSDSLKKRVDFLRAVVKHLNLQNVECIEGRAEDLGRNPEYRGNFDYAVARAVSKVPVLLEYAIPLLKNDGIFFAYKGPDYLEELEESKRALTELNAEIISINRFVISDLSLERNIIAFKKIGDTIDKYPRRPGVPLKRPL